MSLDELRKALETNEEIEYHLMGVEENASLLPGPGWYSCRVKQVYKSGNLEINFTDPELDWLYVTVLKKNIAIAFRRIEQAEAQEPTSLASQRTKRAMHDLANSSDVLKGDLSNGLETLPEEE